MKNKKNKIKIAELLLSIFSFASSVSAAGVYNVSYDLKSENVTVSGNTSAPYANVTLELLRADKTSDELKNIAAEAADTVIFQYDQCTADQDGAFSFVFKIPSDIVTGTYVTRVAWGSRMNESQLIYVSPKDFENALDAVNNAKNNAEMAAAIDNGIKYFGFENPYYNDFSEKQKSALAQAVLEGRPESGYAGSEEFGKIFRPASAVVALSGSEDGAKALEIIEYFNDELEISALKAYPTFEKQTDAVKKEIADSVVKSGNCTDKESVKKEFENKTVVYALYRVAGYDAVSEILKNNNHLFNLDFTAYDNLLSKSAVDKKMTEKLFASASEAAEAFKTYVAQAGQTTSNPGGGNGGGKDSSKSTVSLPQGTGDVNINDNKNTTVKFNDLESVEWARAAIEGLAEKKIVSGKGDGKYDPTAAVKREEFITMLVSLLEIYDKDAKCGFEDVSEGEWYYPYVASAVNAGIVNGLSDSIFGTGKDISKEDIAALLQRAAQLKGKSFAQDGYVGFDDENEISAYALSGVKSLNSAGIINGNGSGKFEPKKSATRAETAVMLYGFLNQLK